MSFPPELFLALVLVAFCGGFISSIAGVGGMIVLPILLWAGLPPLNALATNKFQSVFGTLSSSLNFFRKGHLDFAHLRLALACALIAALAGVLLIQQAPQELLERLIPFVLIVLALYFLWSPRISDEDSTPRMAQKLFAPLIGGGIGFYGGIFGPGMGSFFTVAFVSLRGFNLRKATAHSKPLIFVTNATAMVVFALGGYVVWDLAIAMAAAQFVGARLGSNLVISRGTALIRPLLIGATLALAVKLLWAP